MNKIPIIGSIRSPSQCKDEEDVAEDGPNVERRPSSHSDACASDPGIEDAWVPRGETHGVPLGSKLRGDKPFFTRLELKPGMYVRCLIPT